MSQQQNIYDRNRKDEPYSTSLSSLKPWGADKEELVNIVEKDIEQELNPPLRDITSGLAKGLADTMYNFGAEARYPDRKESLSYFDSQFIKREMKRVKGNITQYARDALGASDPLEINNLRRNVYRQIEKHDLGGFVDNARPWKEKKEQPQQDYLAIPIKKIEDTLYSTLSGYKEVIRPGLYEELSSRIHTKAPLLAERVSRYAPTPANRIDRILESTKGVTNYCQARSIFEKQLIYDALEASRFDKHKAAKYLGDSVRTLNRRIEELGIDLNNRKEQPERKQKMIEEIISTKEDSKAKPVGEMERFQQLVMEYNSKRETERLAKEKEVKTRNTKKFKYCDA